MSASTVKCALTALALLGALAGCRHASAPPPQAAAPYVVFRPAGAEQRVSVELARTEPERNRGLMHRAALADGRGMLFLFPDEQPLQFWMHNTLIPLDMIFLDTRRKIIFIEENAAPLTDAHRGPQQPSRFVLEVPGGWCKSHGVALGLDAEFVNVPLDAE